MSNEDAEISQPSIPTMARALSPSEGSKGASLPPSVVEGVAGFSAGVISCLTVHPLDLLKNRLQCGCGLPMV